MFPKKLIAAGLFACCITQTPTHAITKSNLLMSSIANGLITGGSAGLISTCINNQAFSAPLFGFSVGAVSFMATLIYTGDQIPECRMRTAAEILCKIETNPLVMQNVTTLEEFTKCVQPIFKSENWIESARDDIEKLQSDCYHAMDLVSHALDDVKNGKNADIETKCNNLIHRASNILSVLKTKTAILNMKAFERTLNATKNKAFLTSDLTEENFIKYVNIHFEAGCPLVHALDYIADIIIYIEKTTKMLREHLDYFAEINMPSIITTCQQLVAEAQPLIPLLEEKIDLLLKQKNYEFQTTLYSNGNKIETKIRKLESAINKWNVDINHLWSEAATDKAERFKTNLQLISLGVGCMCGSKEK